MRKTSPSRNVVGRAVFDTAFGPCAIAWSSLGLVRVLLPDRDAATMHARLAATVGERDESGVAVPPPAWAREAMAEITSYFSGVPSDLATIRLDVRGVSPFFRRVYEATRAVPRGEVRSYRAIAEAAGSPAASRAVGQAMARNPWPLVIPCHRVVRAGGELGGFSAPGGATTKARLLELERRG